jgi:hypothetical protein
MNEPGPTVKRFLRISLAAGVAVLIVMCVLLLGR